MFGIVGTVQRKIVWLCVLALMLSYRYHLTATAWKYSHRRTAFSNTCRFHSYCDPQKIAYNSVNTVADINTWKRYLVEFRGIYANFRLLELKEIVATLLYAEVDCSTADSLVDQMRFELSIPDSADVRYPLCVYTHLPNDAIARAAAERSCLIRSIVEVWADSTTSNDLVGQMDANFDRIITPTYLSDTNSNSTWKVEFRRFGRKGKSGLDIQGKQRLLSQFAPLLKKLNGSVDLMQPQHQLLYMEDWHSFHAESNEAIEKMKLNASNMDLISDIIPRRVFFGRIVGNGCSVQTIYDLKQRPFIGTTSMSAVSSHLTAVFSRTSADNDAKPIVLDPFCGTGSLLVAGAHLGADVVGSDYDADSLGLLNEKVAAVIPIKQRSKNSRFRRVDGFSQLGKSPVDNFEHYGTAAKLQQLFAADAAWWVNTPFDDSFHSTPPKLSKHDNQADALCFGQTAIRRYDKVLF